MLTTQEPRTQTLATVDASIQAVGIVFLIGIGALHFLQIVQTFQSTPLLGVAYLMFIGACLVLAVRLLTASNYSTWMATAALGGLAIGAYLFTRVISTPIDNQDVGNWSCMLGLATLFVEAFLVGVSVYRLRLEPATLEAEAAGL